MIKNLNLDFVQEVFLSLAQTRKISPEELKAGWDEQNDNSEWNLEYRVSLQKDFEEQINKMMRYFEMHSMALTDKDLNAAQSTLIHAAVFAQNLANMFESIRAECYKVARDDDRFRWPELEENYEIPKIYSHKLRD